MSELSLRGLVKVYPFAKVEGLLFGRKRAKAIRQRQESQPYTTNEGVLAVQGFDLEIQRGEFIVLLGPSGCGKSTVLRMIAGLEEVSAGDILLDGRSIVELPPEQRDIAMIFQNYSLYPNYTVYENLAFPLKSQHVPREQLQRQVEEVAGMMELDGVLNRYPRELSGGQRQRIAIGRALVRRPRLFLMDEPFSNLDPVLRRRLRGLVKSLHQRLGATFVYVTHDQEEAFALGDRIVVMQNGRIDRPAPGPVQPAGQPVYSGLCGHAAHEYHPVRGSAAEGKGLDGGGPGAGASAAGKEMRGPHPPGQWAQGDSGGPPGSHLHGGGRNPGSGQPGGPGGGGAACPFKSRGARAAGGGPGHPL